MASTQEYGAMKVKFSDNVQATFKAKLINADGQDPAQIYGNIDCSVRPGFQFALFKKTRNEHINVRPGEFIPLNQSEVDVPEPAMGMEILAHLMEYNSDSPDREIVDTLVAFNVGKPGFSVTLEMKGEYGCIELNIVWG